MRADEENRKTKRQIDAYVLEREALLRPEEKVTLNLGTVTTVAAQLETVAHDTRQRVPAVWTQTPTYAGIYALAHASALMQNSDPP